MPENGDAETGSGPFIDPLWSMEEVLLALVPWPESAHAREATGDTRWAFSVREIRAMIAKLGETTTVRELWRALARAREVQSAVRRMDAMRLEGNLGRSPSAEAHAPPDVGAQGPDAPASLRLHPAMQAPSFVAKDARFRLSVGLSERAEARVAGCALELPQQHTLVDVEIVAPAFSPVDGAPLRGTLRVVPGEPVPPVVFELCSMREGHALLQAIFSCNGATLGLAARAIVVGAGTATESRTQASSFEASRADLGPDLTVQILDHGHELVFSFRSPHACVRALSERPPEAVPWRGNGLAFTKDLLRTVPSQAPGLATAMLLQGVGMTVAQLMPPPLGASVTALVQSLGRPPTVLVLTNEPHVPWELAVFEDALEQRLALPFLCTRTDVSRWTFSPNRPPFPPPTSLVRDRMTVISGDYKGGFVSALPEALREAKTLHETYGAHALPAKQDSIFPLLRAGTLPDILHFAGHGLYGGGESSGGLLFEDGTLLHPMHVQGARFRNAPFVFLNACEVGASGRTLELVHGMIPAFLYAGASAALAPLYLVNDREAHDFALAFYARVMQGAPFARALRELRCARAAEALSPTLMAYQVHADPRARFATGGEA